MKDVEKTSVERENSSKRMRRRRRNMSLYGFIVVFIVITIGITVCCTFLFNINEITVSGESSEYTVDEIVTASGVTMGDNLIRLKSSDAEKSILENLLYIETADVKKKFPFSLEISVTKCVPTFNISYEMGTLLVSKKGKILANNGFVTENLPVFYGYDPTQTAPGGTIVSADEHKEKIFTELRKKILSDPENKIVSVDMTDKYETNITYSNGIVFKMGNWNDISYKLSLAENVMSQLDGETGYITMIGDNQCSFRTTEESGFETGIIVPQVTTAVVTDANGTVVTETVTTTSDEDALSEEDDNNDEGNDESSYVDEEAEMFREHDEMVNATEPTDENSEGDYVDEYSEDGETE